MVAILLLCGVGLPLPEEVTLIASGLLVGWHEANFWLASAACSAGILGGDAIIFGLGHHFGSHFLQSGPMQWLFFRPKASQGTTFFCPPRRQSPVHGPLLSRGQDRGVRLRRRPKSAVVALFAARFFRGGDQWPNLHRRRPLGRPIVCPPTVKRPSPWPWPKPDTWAAGRCWGLWAVCCS